MDGSTEKIPLIVVVGPTASGKTGLAVELAKSFDGEVVSADSMQIYKRMDIATAKPTDAEQQGIPHHLIDFLEPDAADFSVASYAKLAHECIADIHARGKTPILAGGTGLYIDAVIDNLDYSGTRGDRAEREKLISELEAEGGAGLLEKLREIDPEYAATLHPNSGWRILRALETYRATGITMSEQQRRSRLSPARYDLCMLGLAFSDRALLYDRINRRVDLMLASGLLDEARQISRSYGGTARQAIGYKELAPYFDGILPLETCVDRLKQMSRRYAKRQLTWFRRDERINWLIVDQLVTTEEITKSAKNVIHKSRVL